MSRQPHLVTAKTLLAAAAVLFALAGCGKGTGKNVVIPGVTGPNVSFVDSTLTLTATLTTVSFDYGGRLPIPELPNSYLEVEPDLQSAGIILSIGVSATDIKALAGNSVNWPDPTALPGGRPIPGIAAGQLPGVAVQVPKWDNIQFYVGAQILGVFVPVKLPFQNYMGTFRFFDPTGIDIGNISIVGEDTAGKNSGFLLLINLGGAVGQLIGM